MNFKISKDLFLKKLNLLNKAISSTCPFQVLNGIKVMITGNNLILVSSDGDLSIKCLLTASDQLIINEEGTIVIDAKYLNEIIKKIDNEFIEIETIDTLYLKISGGKTEYKINCMDPIDFPNIAFVSTSSPIRFETASFNHLVSDTAFACDDKNVKPALNGINVSIKDNKLTLKGSNSFRISINSIDVENKEDINITIPCKYLTSIVSCFEEAATFNLFIDNNRILIEFDDNSFLLKIIDDEYPEIRQKNISPANASTSIKCDVRSLKNAIDKISFIKEDGKSIIELNISMNGLEINTKNNITSASDNVELLEFNGTDLTIHMIADYLKDALRVVRSNEVEIYFTGTLGIILVKDPLNDNTTQIISPYQIR